MQAAKPRPTLAVEAACWERGELLVAGVDEVGRGAWAGPVVAAAVILPPDSSIAEALAGVRDSKLLPPAARVRLAALIYRHALAIGVGSAPAGHVDTHGLLPATALAMTEALAALDQAPTRILIDGLPLRQLGQDHTAIVRGDACCLSIAAASVVAKVTRDRWMAGLDERRPGYGFAAHKGYGSGAHRAALCHLGPCREHRLSFAPVAAIAAQSWA